MKGMMKKITHAKFQPNRHITAGDIGHFSVLDYFEVLTFLTEYIKSLLRFWAAQMIEVTDQTDWKTTFPKSHV